MIRNHLNGRSLQPCIARRLQFPRQCQSTLNYFQNKNPPKPLPGGINANNPQYAHYYNPKRGNRWGKVLLYSLTGLAISGFLAYEFLWPKHTFPSSVLKILRRGLWAESEKEDHNYEKLLAIYKELLLKCEEENLSPISDEYTGVQIKIGEMCERLGRIDEAVDVYYEISQNYFKFLQEHVHDPPCEDTRHVVQKDLRIIIKIAELSKDHVSFLTSLLSIHLDLALHEVVKRLILRGFSMEDLVVAGKNATHMKLAVSAENGVIFDPNQKLDREIWEPFKEEFFNARDLLSALYLVTRGPAWTVTHKSQTLSWMILAGSPFGDTLLNMCNLASLCYLTAEGLEEEELRLKRALKETQAEGFEPALEKSVEIIQQKLREEELKHQDLKKMFIEESLHVYLRAIDICKKIPPNQRNSSVEEATVLATYGAGVVNLHLGNYDEAEKLLKEAVLRAKGSGNDFEVKELERELRKLQLERLRISQGGKTNQELKELRPSDVFVDIQYKD